MRLTRTCVLLGLVLLAMFLWWQDARGLSRRRADLEAGAAGLLPLKARIAEALRAAEEERLERDVFRERARRDTLQAAAIREHPGAPSAGDPWRQPPAVLPHWDPESPFIWIAKDTLAAVPVTPFERDGSLQTLLGGVLALDPETEAGLNRALSGLVGELRRAESERVVLRTDPVDLLGAVTGEQITIEIGAPGSEVAQLRAAFEEQVRAGLGASRAALVLHWGAHWLDRTFDAGPDNSRVYTVVRLADGTFRLGMRSRHGGMSATGQGSFDDYLPEHLRGWFAPLRADGRVPDPEAASYQP